MPSTVEQLSPTRVKLTVEIPFADLKPHLDKAYREIARDLERLRVSYTTAINGYADNGQAALVRLEAAFQADVAPRGEGFPPSRPK